jgi:uncharacterized membrane protein YkvA (DUF1232 family)
MVDTNPQPMTQPVAQPFVRGSKRGMLARIPILGDAGALWRFFQDSEASLIGKAFVLAVVAYVIMPVDLIPDVAPVLGWLDDLGMVFLAFAYLSRVIGKYRE